jgi:hypothetical protein
MALTAASVTSAATSLRAPGLGSVDGISATGTMSVDASRTDAEGAKRAFLEGGVVSCTTGGAASVGLLITTFLAPLLSEA